MYVYTDYPEWVLLCIATTAAPVVLALIFLRRARRGKVLLLTGSASIALWAAFQFVESFAFSPYSYLYASLADRLRPLAGSMLTRAFFLLLLPVGVALLALAVARAGSPPKARPLVPPRPALQPYPYFGPVPPPPAPPFPPAPPRPPF